MIEMHFSCYNNFDSPLRINETFGRQNHYETHSIKIHNTISLSCLEQVCLSGLRFERYFSHQKKKRERPMMGEVSLET